METFGFNKLTTYLVQVPPYANTASSGKFQESFWHIVVLILLIRCVLTVVTYGLAAWRAKVLNKRLNQQQG